MSPDLRYLRINERMAAFSRKGVEDHLGRTVAEVSPELDEEVSPLMKKILETGEPVFDIEMRFPDHTGGDSMRDWLVSYYPLVSAEGENLGLGVVVQEFTAIKEAKLLRINEALEQEIAERKEAEGALKRTEQELRRVLTSIPDYLWSVTVDRGGSIHSWYYSPVIEKITGRPAEYFEKGVEAWLEIIHADDRPRLQELTGRVMAGESTSGTNEYRIVRPDGSIRWVRDSFNVTNVADGNLELHGVVSDITERKAAEEQRQRAQIELQRAQRLKAIGVLAGGIAHDFNNILATITNFTYLSSQQVRPESGVARHLEQVMEASTRARDLVRQILTFSREGEQERKPLLIAPVVKEALKLVRASLPAMIEIKQRIRPDSGMVLADITQIQQILVNLCTNSYHSIGDKGGVVEVELSAIEVGKREGVEQGPHVCLTVSDTGAGMSPEVRERIFEPFFTTKAVGQGTGLGLSVVHGIVTRHDGAIFVRSNPGIGTVFEIYLPRLTEQEQAPSEAETAEPGAEGPGAKRILFVDDEPSLVQATELILESLGYEVTALSSSNETLLQFRKRPYHYDAIISDINMPEMTGIELARKALEIRPGVPIVLVTGFSDLISEEEAKKMGIRALMMKPYHVGELSAVLREIFDSADAATAS